MDPKRALCAVFALTVAVACAVEMQMAMAEFNRQNQKDGLPALAMGPPTPVFSTPIHLIPTIKRIELCQTGSSVDSTGATAPNCVNPYIIASGSFDLDIASRTAGAQLGRFATIDASTWPVGRTNSTRYWPPT